MPFFTRSLTLGVLFSIVVRVTAVDRLEILSISFLISFTLELRVILVAKLVILDILSSILLILALYASFTTT